MTGTVQAGSDRQAGTQDVEHVEMTGGQNVGLHMSKHHMLSWTSFC